MISLGSGQLANYEISYNLAITRNDQLKLGGQKVLQKRHKCIKVFVVKATVSVPRFILYMDTEKRFRVRISHVCRIFQLTSFHQILAPRTICVGKAWPPGMTLLGEEGVGGKAWN